MDYCVRYGDVMTQALEFVTTPKRGGSKATAHRIDPDVSVEQFDMEWASQQVTYYTFSDGSRAGTRGRGHYYSCWVKFAKMEKTNEVN